MLFWNSLAFLMIHRMLAISIPLLIVNFSHLEGVSVCPKYVRDTVCILDGETGLCPKAVLDCFSLVSYPILSLINNCLNLPRDSQVSQYQVYKSEYQYQGYSGISTTSGMQMIPL